MIRYRIEHDRDIRTHAGCHWNVVEVDTADPPRDGGRCVGWGSYEACLAFTLGLVALRAATGVRW